MLAACIWRCLIQIWSWTQLCQWSFLYYFQDPYCHTILEQNYTLFNVRVVEVWLTMKRTVYGV